MRFFGIGVFTGLGIGMTRGNALKGSGRAEEPKASPRDGDEDSQTGGVGVETAKGGEHGEGQASGGLDWKCAKKSSSASGSSLITGKTLAVTMQ